MPQNKQKSIPTFLAQARAFYADAFAHNRKAALSDAMSEWEDLDDAEQRFTLAHLSYLHIEAQAQNQQLLTQIRDLLDELAEGLTVAVEAFAEGPVEEEAEEDFEMDNPPLELPSLPVPDVIDAEPSGGAA